MNDVIETTPTGRPKRSLVQWWADRCSMEPAAFMETMKKTVMPSNATNEELAAFLIVAKEYRLSPILREIHAFPKKGGGIMPVISIDGWVSMVNQHPSMDGMEFTVEENEPATAFPFAITCRLFRKDRARPIEVTEYFSECYRATEPWKAKPRTMLRHKALIQCARYAFGFSGVVDEDEAERIEELTPVEKPVEKPEKPIAKVEQWAKPEAVTFQVEKINMETGEIGEIVEKPFRTDGPWELGRKARDSNYALKAVPPEWRDPERAVEADAWQGGWKERDAELTKKS